MVSPIQRWAAFSLSVACALLSLTCALGLLASIAMTFATQGRALLAACTFGSPELLALAPNCPFDPTRIYVSVKAWDGMGVIQVLIRGGKGSWSPAFFPQLQTTYLPLVPLQSSSLCLWGISLVFCVAESVFAVRCAQLIHQLLELRPWWGKSSLHMVRPVAPSTALTPHISREPLLGRPHPSNGSPT